MTLRRTRMSVKAKEPRTAQETTMADLHIEQIAPAALTPWARNARTHSKKQLRQIANSIRSFGFTNPVLIDRQNTILAGL